MKKAKFEKLLEPLEVRKVKFRNRIVSAAHASFYGEKGYVSERDKVCYEDLAKGGVGMLTVGACYLNFGGAMGPRCLIIDDDKFIPGFSELTHLIHKHGCPTFLQLAHSGPRQKQRMAGFQPVASSSLSDQERPVFYDRARQLTIAEIEDLVDKFASAAERVRNAGFDGVEIHAAHSYLINSFLSRAWNKRQDAYGCQDLESRARFAVEIIRTIKERAGQDFPVGIRFNGGECGLEKGITSEESQGFGRMFQEAGADYLHISGYGYGPYVLLYRPEQILYPEPAEEVRSLARRIKKPGALVTWAEAIKKVVSIPVIGVGRLNPGLGEWLLQKGKVDLVALARGLMADPELPNKVASGRLEDIRPCVACNECNDRANKQEPVQCRVNAALGREQEYVIKPVEKRKRVVVVGGGPSGMEAARVAALRGHEVILYEREHRLGGLLPVAALVKGCEIEDLVALVRYFRTQITKLGVKIRVGREVNLALVEEIKPDVVILATGGIPAVPKIPGIDGHNVVSSAELQRKLEIPLRLLGPRLLRWLTRLWMPIGKEVVVIGGLIHGCETAEFLVKRGRKVTIVETSNQLGTGIPDINSVRLLSWLAKKGVTMLTEARYEEITDRGLTIVNREGERRTIEADTILTAIPSISNTELCEALQGKVPEIYLIGDCKEPRLILEAIADGARIARAV